MACGVNKDGKKHYLVLEYLLNTLSPEISSRLLVQQSKKYKNMVRKPTYLRE